MPKKITEGAYAIKKMKYYYDDIVPNPACYLVVRIEDRVLNSVVSGILYLIYENVCYRFFEEAFDSGSYYDSEKEHLLTVAK